MTAVYSSTISQVWMCVDVLYATQLISNGVQHPTGQQQAMRITDKDYSSPISTE